MVESKYMNEGEMFTIPWTLQIHVDQHR